MSKPTTAAECEPFALDNDELASLVAGIDAYCCGHLNQITRSYQAMSLDYVLAGAGSKQYAKAIELRAKLLAELERRKGTTPCASPTQT